MKKIVKIKTTTRKFIFITSAVTILLTYGCSKDNPLNPLGGCFGGAVWSENILNETAALAEAGQAYQDNPSKSNCDKYKTATKSYLDALKGVAECVPGTSKAEYNKAIEEAKADLDKEGCD